MRSITTRITTVVTIALFLHTGAFAKLLSRNPQQTREEYIARIQQQTPSVSNRNPLGSLWGKRRRVTNLQVDYKASRLNDLVTIIVLQNTTAQATGTPAPSVTSTRNLGFQGWLATSAPSGVTISSLRNLPPS